ncbi:MAG TPA: HAMP domain-containing protein [Blastocatellia bacterium]|nr:HAMP domain-containing protein [Blastocatellia bacterium]
MINSIRAKLTIWYTAMLAVVVIIFSIGVYVLLSNALRLNLDRALRASIEAAAISLTHEIDEGETPVQAANSILEDLSIPEQALAVYDTQGRLLAERHTRDQAAAGLPEQSLISQDRAYFYSVPNVTPAAEGTLRTAAQRIRIAPYGPTFLVVTSQSIETVNEELAVLRRVFYIAVPLVLLLTAGGGWFLARRSLAPVAAMSRRASQINAENFDDRLPVVNPRDELGQLAMTFNELLARINAPLAQQRQLMADASLGLRTPLHIVRTAAAVTLERTDRNEADYRDALFIINEQTIRLTQIVEEIFLLARTETGQRLLERRDFHFEELVAQAAAAVGSLAETRRSLEPVPKPQKAQ